MNSHKVLLVTIKFIKADLGNSYVLKQILNELTLDQSEKALGAVADMLENIAKYIPMYIKLADLEKCGIK